MGKNLHKMVQMLSTVGYTERKGGMKEALTCVRGSMNQIQIPRSAVHLLGVLSEATTGNYEAGLGGGS